ncbi:hypothetical protein ACH5RR_006874 [Cinchona calisaya]|uniref:Reverse transcriptase/retrotransposon-derived protein RNase H-like domain-containing protein n=1 Tax=Cinchona calisaya TaxID=153742 RepID=A0ABD3AQ97_9GENT
MDGFMWDEAIVKAFQDLKVAMSIVLVLRLSYFSKAFVIETDACGTGMGNVLMQVKSLFYLSFVKKDMIAYVQQCDICQRNKHKNIPYLGLLQTLPIPSQVWSRNTMDFIENLPFSEGKDTILVLIDRVAHFLPLSHPFTAS